MDVRRTGAVGSEVADAEVVVARFVAAVQPGSAGDWRDVLDELRETGETGVHLLVDAAVESGANTGLYELALVEFGLDGALVLSERLADAEPAEAEFLIEALHASLGGWEYDPEAVAIAARALDYAGKRLRQYPPWGEQVEGRVEGNVGNAIALVRRLPTTSRALEPELVRVIQGVVDRLPDRVRSWVVGRHDGPAVRPAVFARFGGFEHWGPRAAHLVPVLLEDWEDLDAWARLGTLDLLRAVGPVAPPQVLEHLRSVLRTKDTGELTAALDAVVVWRSRAIGLAPELTALLRHEDETIRDRAAIALCVVGAPPLQRMEVVIDALGDDWSHVWGRSSPPAPHDRAQDWVASEIPRRPDWVAAVRSTFPRAETGAACRVAHLLARALPAQAEGIASDLVESGTTRAELTAAQIRGMNADGPRWVGCDMRGAASDLAALGSGSDTTRFRAAKRLYLEHPRHRATARRALLHFLDESDSPHASEARELLAAELEDTDATHRALAVLRQGFHPLPEWYGAVTLLDHCSPHTLPDPGPAAMDRLLDVVVGEDDAVVDRSYAPTVARIVLRMDGGGEALHERIEEHIRVAAAPWHGQALPVLVRAFPDWADRHRDRLHELTARPVIEVERQVRSDVWSALAERSGDIDRLARHERDPLRAVPWLLERGAAGRRALIRRLASVEDREIDWWLRRIPDDADLGPTLLEAAQPGADDELRLGAARAVTVVDTGTAFAVAGRLLDDAATPVRRAIHQALRVFASREVTIPPALVVATLRDPDGVHTGLDLLPEAGPVDATTLDALRLWLEDDDARFRVEMARRWVAVGGDPRPAARAVRRALQERLDLLSGEGWWRRRSMPRPLQLDWDHVATVLETAGVESGDAELIPWSGYESDDDAVARLQTRLAPHAADKLPILIDELLATAYPWNDGGGEHELRILTAMGPAAAPAERDIRDWIALTGDSDGLGAAALRAITGD